MPKLGPWARDLERLLEANKRQLDVMRGLIVRADITLGQVDQVLGADLEDERKSRLSHEIGLLRDLINAIQLNKL